LNDVQLPFTADQFFGIFADYNQTFWPVAVVLWLMTVLAVALVWWQPARWSPMLSLFLGALWLWNAAAYHALLFTRINRAAWIFSLLFAFQAALFMRAGLQKRLLYVSTGARQGLGMGLAAYSLLYPFLTMGLGHDYPATPTFGLPCPTAILTMGLLLTVSGKIPFGLAVVPIVWGFIGGSAATLLDVPTDYVLLAAGMLLLIVLVAQRSPRARSRALIQF
jgi:hypothetical protein